MKIEKWSIWRANLDPVVGSEQGKTRPVIIISENDVNSILSIVNIIPVTTRKAGRNIYPNEVLLPENSFGLISESIALCHQIRTIDKRRLTHKYGSVDLDKIQEEIYDALCFQLGLTRR